MLKRNLKTIIITSLLTLIPMFIGLALWDKLPESIPTHFNINNEPDGYSSKAFAVFGLPLIMLAMQFVCIFATKVDPKGKSINDKVLTLVLYIIPATSLLVCMMSYPVALGKETRVGLTAIIFMGFLFVIIGNYLPKCRQNYTVGIKLPWTLSDSENWNKTHALAGKLWVIGGFVIIATAFMENPVIFFGIIIIMTLVPTVYSYLLFRKKSKEKSDEAQ